MDWVLERQRGDGSFSNPDDGVGAYYKIPFFLALSGRGAEAQRLLEWVAQHHLREDGDFRSPLRKSLRSTHTRWPDYANAWIVMGAHMAGRWDISYPGVRRIAAGQGDHGGFEAREGAERYIEPVNTSWAGMACLATGRVDAAVRAADLMRRMAEDQIRDGVFYFRMRPDGSVITALEGVPRRAYAMSSVEDRQISYNPGIAMIFLASAYRATGRAEYLGACNELLRFCDRCPSDVYRLPPSGKLGMGCALVHQITGDPMALRGARAVAEYLLDTQQADGSWQLPAQEPSTAREDRLSPETTLDLTAEFGVFLLAMSAVL